MTGYQSKKAAAQGKVVVTDLDGHVVRGARKPRKAAAIAKVEGPIHVVCQCDKCKAQQGEHMTKDEALKQAREWIKAQPRGWMTDGFNEVIADINEALAQPAQESMDDVRGFLAARLTCWHRLTEKESDELVALFEVKPPQRTWVGLTDEEYEKLAEKYVTNCYFDTLKYAKAMEQLLKDKNT